MAVLLDRGESRQQTVPLFYCTLKAFATRLSAQLVRFPYVRLERIRF